MTFYPTALDLVLLHEEPFHVPVLKADYLTRERVLDSRRGHSEHLEERLLVVVF